jgi:hypothetical protein
VQNEKVDFFFTSLYGRWVLLKELIKKKLVSSGLDKFSNSTMIKALRGTEENVQSNGNLGRGWSTLREKEK